jgi:hypothetical protein
MMKLNKPLPEINFVVDEEEEQPPRVCQVRERGINALEVREWNVLKSSLVTEEGENDAPSGSLAKTFSTAIRSFKRRVGSREEAKSSQ